MKWHLKSGMRYSPWMKWNFHFIYGSWSRCPMATVKNTWCRWHLLLIMPVWTCCSTFIFLYQNVLSRGPQEFKNYPGLIFLVKALGTPPLLPSKWGMFSSKKGMFFPPFFWRNFPLVGHEPFPALQPCVKLRVQPVFVFFCQLNIQFQSIFNAMHSNEFH